MIVNGLAIGIPVLLLAAGCGLVVLLLRRDDGRHAADALFTAAPVVHHAEYTPYDYTPAPPGLVPGAGLNLSPGSGSRPAQSTEDIGMKADSPAPENVPGRDRTDPAGDQDPPPDTSEQAETAANGSQRPWWMQDGELPPMSPLLAAALREAEDAERYPDLMHGHGFADATGSFTAIAGGRVMAAWSPLGGTEWLRQPDWVLDEEHPERPVSVPAGRNNLPLTVPYTYGGGDFSLPAEVTVRASSCLPRPRRGRPLDDPEWLAADVPFSAPAEWLAELAEEAQ